MMIPTIQISQKMKNGILQLEMDVLRWYGFTNVDQDICLQKLETETIAFLSLALRARKGIEQGD